MVVWYWLRHGTLRTALQVHTLSAQYVPRQTAVRANGKLSCAAI